MGNHITNRLLTKDEQKLLMIYYYKMKHLMDKFMMPFNEQQQYSFYDLGDTFRLPRKKIKSDIQFYLISHREAEISDDFVRREILPEISGKEHSRLVHFMLSLSVSLEAENLIVTDIPEQPDRSGHLEPIDKRQRYLDDDNIRVSFTNKGFDLAKQYSSTWLYMKLWYINYIEDHPVIKVVGFIMGFVLGILAGIIIGRFTN